jgi:hypothetical protein
MTLLAHRPGSGWNVLVQAAVLVIVFVILAITPAPVTFPSGTWELVLLLKGGIALLLTDLILSGATGDERATPVGRLTARLIGGRAAPNRLDHYHVQDTGGTIGVVDEVLADRSGTTRALVVTDGWHGRRRFLVDMEDLRAVDHGSRTVTIGDRLGWHAAYGASVESPS